MKKTTSRLLIAALFALGLAVPVSVGVASSPACALSGACSATRETKSQVGLDAYRTRASCSSLSGDARARAKLIRRGGPDYYSSWFTTLNKSYYTNYYTCYLGCSATYEIGPRY